jgi:hypothetical protein
MDAGPAGRIFSLSPGRYDLPFPAHRLHSRIISHIIRTFILPLHPTYIYLLLMRPWKNP